MPRKSELPIINIIPATGVKKLPKSGQLIEVSKDGDLQVQVTEKKGRAKKMTVRTCFIPRCNYSMFYYEEIVDVETGETVETAEVTPSAAPKRRGRKPGTGKKGAKKKATNGRRKKRAAPAEEGAAPKRRGRPPGTGKKGAKKKATNGRRKKTAAPAEEDAAPKRRGRKPGTGKKGAKKAANGRRKKRAVAALPWDQAPGLGNLDNAFEGAE